MTAATPSAGLAGLGRQSERVLLALRADLDRGAYAPESRLPAEAELCRLYGASRNTLRRAVARLAVAGRLEVVQGSGTYVRPDPQARPPSRTLAVMFPFDTANLAAAQQVALDLGYLLCVYTHTPVAWSPASERRFLEQVRHERHRALLAFCTPYEPSNDDLLDELVRQGTRVIHVEVYRRDPPAQDYILPDYRRGGALAATTLMIAGYTQFRYLSVAGDGPYAGLAWEGFREALAEQGHAVDESWHLQIPSHFEHLPAHRAARERFFARLPPNCGLFLRSASLARGIMELVRARGRRVPDDVGVIGIEHLLTDNGIRDVDTVSYDWTAQLVQAIQAAAAPRWTGLREWLKPKLIRTGSVR